AAGEVCDGLHVRSFGNRKYLTEVILPNVEAGLQKGGRRRGDFVVACHTMIATGRTDAEVERAAAEMRRRIAFYAATRTYRPVLAVHPGWEEIGQRLHPLSLAGKWAEMEGLIPDEMLQAFAVIGRYDQLPSR